MWDRAVSIANHRLPLSRIMLSVPIGRSQGFQPLRTEIAVETFVCVPAAYGSGLPGARSHEGAQPLSTSPSDSRFGDAQPQAVLADPAPSTQGKSIGRGTPNSQTNAQAVARSIPPPGKKSGTTRWSVHPATGLALRRQRPREQRTAALSQCMHSHAEFHAVRCRRKTGAETLCQRARRNAVPPARGRQFSVGPRTRAGRGMI